MAANKPRKIKQRGINLPYVIFTTTRYSIPGRIPRVTTTRYTRVRPSRQLPPVPRLTSTEENNDNGDWNSIEIDDGNHEEIPIDGPSGVNHGWGSLMSLLAFAYIDYKYADEEYEADITPDPRGIRPKPDPRDITIPTQNDCICGNVNARSILRNLYVLKDQHKDALIEDIANLPIQYQQYIMDLKIQGYFIIGYCRKSKTTTDNEKVTKCLQSMVLGLKERSLAQKVYVTVSYNADLLQDIHDNQVHVINCQEELIEPKALFKFDRGNFLL